MIINNFLGHLRTVQQHRHQVFIHCLKAGIPWRGLVHDLSKFSPTEFIPGVLYYQGNRSPNEREREVDGSSKAWMHHKGRNKHHFEFWYDYEMATKKLVPIDMPDRYIKEMFCDRLAASKIYKGKDYNNHESLEYFRRGNARAKMHPETADLLEKWLTILSEEGEDAAFEEIRNTKEY